MFCLTVLLAVAAASPEVVDLTTAPGVGTAIVCRGQGYFPVVDRTPDGRAAAVLRGGGGHLGIGGRLDLFFSDDGFIWYGKRTAVDTAADDRNPAFCVAPNGRFLLGIHHQAGYNGDGVYDPSFQLSRNMQTYSDDEGVTWSRLTNVKLGPIEGTSPYGRIVRLSDGTFLQNVYGAHSPDVPNIPAPKEGVSDYAYVVRSTDEGVTWSDPSLVAEAHNETALLQVDDGALLAAARHDGESQYLDLYRSEDLGRTWIHVVQATDNSQHPADLVNLGNDVILMLYGNRRDEAKDIRAVLSRDGGKTWDTGTHLSLTSPVGGDFGYPSGVVMGENLLVLHYWAGEGVSSYDGSKSQCRATRIPVKVILGAGKE